MKAELVRIGNSRGIRIPKPIIEQLQLGDSIELTVEDGRLILSSDRGIRRGWRESFRAAGPAERDQLLLKSVPASKFDREEWEW